MNSLHHLTKYIRKFEHVKGQLQPGLQRLAGKARAAIINRQGGHTHGHRNSEPAGSDHYRPTPYLAHPFAQAVYNLSEPKLKLQYERERIYFEDGGHVSLDWALPLRQASEVPGSFESYEPSPETPIFFVMHGLTGGSEMNYIKVLVEEARKNGYRSVCLNSRGICNEMTSPIPFTAIDFCELEAALELIQKRYPDAPLYLVGTSFGANYLTRYLIRNRRPSVKGFVALASPFDIIDVVTRMGPVYQKFFVKRYIEETVKRHKVMQHWEDIGLVNLKDVYRATNLWEFHERITVKITQQKDVQSLFQCYSIGSEVSQIQVPSLFMNAIDDPIVSSEGIPKELAKNPYVDFRLTKSGGHVCWYQGTPPKRWYPKPTITFLNKLRDRRVQPSN